MEVTAAGRENTKVQGPWCIITLTRDPVPAAVKWTEKHGSDAKEGARQLTPHRTTVPTNSTGLASETSSIRSRRELPNSKTKEERRGGM